MPELPEVETVRQVLRNSVLNRTITDIDIRYKPIIDNDIDYFKNNVIGKKIVEINRLGKYLIFMLNEGAFLSHLRMEGKYFYILKDSMDNKHIHVIFYLDNGYMLCYQDVRKFGRIEYKNTEAIYTTSPLKNVGIDPILSKKIEILEIYGKIIKKYIPIKTALLDQSILCGLGNIYVDEVLYACHILPTRISNTLSMEEVENIVVETKRILNTAISLKGTTIRSYTSSLGVEGQYQNFLCVHLKKDCPNCKKELSIIKIGGRSTYFCKECQR